MDDLSFNCDSMADSASAGASKGFGRGRGRGGKYPKCVK